MKRRAALLLCLGFAGLIACSRVENDFIVHDPENAIASAELRLCGERLQLAGSEGEFRGRLPITCEGEGDILVSLSDGREASCHIGYVTDGLDQTFEFIVRDGQCGGGRASGSPGLQPGG